MSVRGFDTNDDSDTLREVGIAIVGQGTMARAHAQAYSELGLGEQIRYICAPGAPRPIADAPHATFVTDLNTALADPLVSVVSVCTPTTTHAQIAIRALQRAKHVLLEKPIALSMTDARAIQAAAAHSERILMVAHVVRFFGGYRALRAAADSGRLGRILSVTAQRISGVPGASEWWHDQTRSGGMLVDFAIHDFDQLNVFLGTPRTVSARQAHPDGPIETTVEYADGGIGRVQTFMGMAPGVPFLSSIDVLGSKGSANHQFIGAPDVTHTTPASESIRLITAEGAADQPVDAANPYARQIEHFLECVANGTPSTVAPTLSAVAALTVSLAARRSLASDRTVAIAIAR
jgi:predicted dehydrogenase